MIHRHAKEIITGLLTGFPIVTLTHEAFAGLHKWCALAGILPSRLGPDVLGKLILSFLTKALRHKEG